MKLDKLSQKAHPHTEIAGLIKDLGFGPSIMDAPAGKGTLSAELVQIGFQVTACDLHPERIAVPGIRCERVDLSEPFPFTAEQFDGIACLEGIEHLEDQYRFMRECWRVLRPGGKILITTPNILSLKSRIAWLFTGANSLRSRLVTEAGGPRGTQHIHLVSYFQLRHVLHSSGFKIVFLSGLRYSKNALALAWLWPAIHFFSRRCLPDDSGQPGINQEILRHVMSWDMLLSKKLVIVAEKAGSRSTSP